MACTRSWEPDVRAYDRLVDVSRTAPDWASGIIRSEEVRDQLQLDEVYAVLRDVNAGSISDDEAIRRLERSPSWVWTAMDPTSKLLVGVDVGNRTLAMAQRVVHQVVQGLAPGCVPLFLTDGFKEYATALLTHCGQWVQPSRRQDKGPHPG